MQKLGDLIPASDYLKFFVARHFLDGALVLDGVGRFEEIVNPHRLNNRRFAEIMESSDFAALPMRLDLYGPFDTLAEASAAATVLAAMQAPLCRSDDVLRFADGPRQVVIQRGPEQGRIFESPSQAAKLLDLDRSAVYRHLKKTPGFRSVKGYEFVYFDDLPEDMKRQVLAMQP